MAFIDRSIRRRPLAVLCIALVLVGGCASETELDDIAEPTLAPESTAVAEPTAVPAATAVPEATAVPTSVATTQAEPTGTVLPTTTILDGDSVPTHPWYPCDPVQYALAADYRVVNIPADDPDGGLVAHAGPGVDTSVTEVLADGMGELQIAGCQQNLNQASVWWLVEDRGWVNSHYLQAHNPFVSDWQPGLSDPIDSVADTVIGLEAPDMEALGVLLRDELIGEHGTVIPLGEFVGVDARGGFAAFDLLGLRDDSVAGYRIELVIEFLKDETATDILGFRVVRATARAVCSRGAGRLCL